ncbi:sigma-70 family RNA polymerase sigma factor [Streptomyces anulatus]|uniref:sigma-70 family RNA polymerase sigma factor n=1 Tax=Streptomyces anulatus TaxID=1892 RepID=UPI00369C4083
MRAAGDQEPRPRLLRRSPRDHRPPGFVLHRVPPDEPGQLRPLRRDLPPPRQDAEEAIDSAFEHLLRTWDQVLLTENPAAYAWTVTRNKVIDHARARTRRPPLIEDAAFDTVALRDAVDPIGQITESLALFRALRQLTDRQQDVMVMTYLQGMNAPEVAAVLGMSSPTVRSTVRHSLRRLREILGPDRTMEGRR